MWKKTRTNVANVTVVGAVSWQAQRRLAQNREAARKSRMRKKVIIPYGSFCTF
jgi:hypothetical protein